MSWSVKLDPADLAFSKWIRLRDRECVRCHSAVKLNDRGLPVSHQASHFQGRRKENTRFDPDNVDTLCAGCHSYLGANPAEHYEFQVKLKGQDKVEEVVLKSNIYHKKDRRLEALFWQRRLKQDYGV